MPRIQSAPRILVPVALAALACAAVWLHLPAQTSRPSPFQRGAYGALARAEACLRSGDTAGSLRAFRAAYVRTRHEAQSGLAERVRWRIGAAGKDLLLTDARAAWPFFEAFALLSPDFSGDALAVEGLVLDATRGATSRFEYDLVRPDGLTYWGAFPEVEWTGLWPLWRSYQSLTGKPMASGIYLEARPDWPARRFTCLIPVDLRGGTLPFPAALEVRAPFAKPAVCWVQERAPFREAKPAGQGRWSLDGITQKRGQVPVRVLFFSDAVPPRAGVRVTLVREYKPL
ncbi:MAG: hypothetical protein ACOYXN_10630 [Acidobacteriota bacterium]